MFCQVVSNANDVLSRRPYGYFVAASRDRVAVSFEWMVQLNRSRIESFDDCIAFRECLVDVAVLFEPRLGKVRLIFPHARRSVFLRILFANHEGHLLHFYLNDAQGIETRLLRRACDGRKFLTVISRSLI